MMKKWLMILICACLLTFAGRSQINLCFNPSFENYTACPDMYDETKYAYWTGLDTIWGPPDWAHAIPGVPDFCNKCATYLDLSIPQGTYYYHYPRTGNGMMQVEMFYDEGYMCACPQQRRDYLQGRLTNSLIRGNNYLVTFYVSSAGASYYSVNNIGAYIDDGTIDTTHNPGYVQTQYTPQIVEHAIINDTAAGDTITWVKIQDTFTANGTEKFITIGQFTDKAHTNFFAIKDTTGGSFFSLYLVDDISIINCDNIPYAGHDTLIHPGDSAFIGPHEGLLPYTWYKMPGTTPIDSGGGIWVKPTTTTTYILEQKLCGTTKYDTIKLRVWPDTVTEANNLYATQQQYSIFPNPNNGSFVVEQAVRNTDGVKLTILDALGRQIYQQNAVFNSGKLSMNPGITNSGLYLLQIIDSNGELHYNKFIVK